MSIFLLCIIFAAGIVGMYFLVSLYSRLVYKVLVTDKLSAVDEVMETGDVPARWQPRRCSAFLQRTDGTVIYAIWASVFKRHLIRRLTRLIKYTQHSAGLNRNEKESYRLELEDILNDWRGKTTRELL